MERAIVDEPGVVMLDGWMRIVTADHQARLILKMPTEARRRFEPHVLDEKGRPIENLLAHLKVIPFGVHVLRVCGIRWQRDGEWVWVHATFVRTSKNEGMVLVSPFRGEPPRRRGWDCQACGKPTMAVAAYRERELCLPCWQKTATFRLEVEGAPANVA